MDTRVPTTAWHARPSVAGLVLPLVGTSLAGSLMVAGSLLLIRRVSGAATMPLNGWCLLASATVLTSVAWIIRWAWTGGMDGSGHRPEADGRAALAWIGHAAAGAASGLVLLAVSTPASGIAFLAGAWLVWLGSEATAWCFQLATEEAVPFPSCGIKPIAPRPRREEPQVPANGSAQSRVPTTLPEPREKENESDAIPANLVQQVTRLFDDAGERVEALAQVAIEAGDCLGVLHLAFGPPLAGPPDLAACVVDEPGATVRITNAETFGVRVEVRLPQPVSQRQAVWVEIHGVAPNAAGTARSLERT